jgi:hypothetical protein
MMSFPLELNLPDGTIVRVDTPDQFDDLLLDLLYRSSPYAPDILTIENIHGHNVRLGLARESFVHIWSGAAGSRSMITRGDHTRMGTQLFFLNQKHPIKVETRYLIPFMVARRVVFRYITEGELSKEVEWVEKLTPV